MNIFSQIDSAAAAELRTVILTRIDFVRILYKNDTEARLNEWTRIRHLCIELGIDFDVFLMESF